MRTPRTAHHTVGARMPMRVIAAAAVIATVASVWAFRQDLGIGSKRSGTDLTASTAATGENHATGAHAGAGASDQPINTAAAATSGPVSELDKQLLVKVRQANLWELPAGRLAQNNASSEQVKRAGLHLIDGHSRLDQIVREISVALGVPIPNEPTADQKAWVQQLKTSRGAEFDRFFANQLRNAHGKVFVVIAQVRATTQNSVIRDLAIEANLAVADHQEVLEDTGLVERGTFEDVAKTVITG